ncbi:MAG: iron complex outermembrane receptor protein, partial [Gammaproteobacteria bacterium]
MSKDQKSFFKRFAVPLAGAAVLGMPAIAVIAQDDEALEIEEVVITGSYLKSSPKDGASPIAVVDREGIDQMGAITISDITRNLTANSGAENV